MKLNRTDGIGPSRGPDVDQDDQPPAQRLRHGAPSANATNMLNLSPAPRRTFAGQERDSTALHVRVQASGPALTAEPPTAVHARMHASAPSGTSLVGERPSAPSGTTESQPSPRPLMNAVAPLPASLIGEFRDLPRRGSGQSLSMYANRLLRQNPELTLRLAHGLACRRLSNTLSSDADHRRVNQMFAAANAEPRRQNESYSAYQRRRRITVIRGTAQLIGTTTRALMEDLASLIDRHLEGNANMQHVASTISEAHANTSDAAMPASPLALPVAPQRTASTDTHPGQPGALETGVGSSRAHAAPMSGPSTQPLASSQGAPSNRVGAHQYQSAALAGSSGTAELQTGSPPRTHEFAPLSGAWMNEFRHLPPPRPNEPNQWYAHRLYEAHGWRFVPLLYQFANDRLPDNEARVQMALGRARLPNRQQMPRSAAAIYERHRDMLGIHVAADLLHTTANALMMDLASRIAESHPDRQSSSVAQPPDVSQAIDHAITRDTLDMLTGMHDQEDMRAQAYLPTFAGIDHLGDIDSLPEPDMVLAIDRAITRDALDMLTGMHDQEDMRAQAHPHTLAVIDHLGDIGSLPEQALHPRVVEAVRTANSATQLAMNLRDMVAAHPDVLPRRQRAQQRN